METSELLKRSKKQYIAKVGNTFLVSPMSKDSIQTMSDEELDNLLGRFPGEMRTCLKNTPNIIKFSEDMEAENNGCFCIEKDELSGAVPNFFDHVSFQAVWPRKNQTLSPWHSGDVVETFNIVYNGAIFLAFGESGSTDDSIYAWNFGLEAMKIIKTTFGTSNLWNVATTGPIMLHPALNFAFLDPDIDLALPLTREREGNLYVLFRYEDEDSCELMMREFFSDTFIAIQEHYESLLLRGHILESGVEFRQKLDAMALLHQDMLRLGFWNPLHIKTRYAYVGQLRKSIREMYELYIELAENNAGIIERRSRASRDLLTHRFLAPLASYFNKQLSDVGNTDYSPVLQGVKFFEDETRATILQRTTLDAAILGALVGTLIGALLTRAF